MPKSFPGRQALRVPLVTSALALAFVIGAEPIWRARAGAYGAEAPRLIAQVGHSDSVTGVAFALDGRCAVSIGVEGSIRIWDTKSGALLRSIETPGGTNQGLSSIAVTPDGRRVLAGGDFRPAKLWDVASGRLLQTFGEGRFGSASAAFSPDGRRVLIVDFTGTARICDAESGVVQRSLEPIREPVPAGNVPPGVAVLPWWGRRAAFSPDGRKALIGGPAAVAHLWDLGTGERICSFEGHKGWVTCVAFSPDGKRVLTGSLDHTTRLWDAESGQLLRTLRGFPKKFDETIAMPPRPTTGMGLDTIEQEISDVGFSPDGLRILTVDRLARLWDADSGEIIRSFEGKGRELLPGMSGLWATTAAFSRDGRQLLVGCLDGTIRLYDTASGESLSPYQGRDAWANVSALSPDGRRLLTAGGFGPAWLWDLASGHPVRSFNRPDPDALITSAAFAPDGRRFVTADSRARLWNPETGELLRTFDGDTRLGEVAFSPDNRHVLIGHSDGIAQLRDCDTGDLKRGFPGHVGGVSSVAFSHDGRRILTGGRQDQTAWLWDVENDRVAPKIFRACPDRPKYVGGIFARFHPEGRLVLTAGCDDGARLWNADTGELVRSLIVPRQGDNEGDSSWIQTMAFSPDGGTLLTGGGDGVVRFWNVKSGFQRRVLTGFGRFSMPAVTITPDGRRALIVGGDQTGLVWDLESDCELCRFYNFDDRTWAVVDPSGRYDAANGGAVDGLHWVVGVEPIDLDQLKARYYDPGLLAKSLGFSKEPLRTVAGLADVRLYPEIEVAMPGPDDAAGVLAITLSDRGGGIGRVAIKVNGKEVAADARGAAEDTDPRPDVARFSIPLAGDPRLKPGVENTVEVIAYNTDGSLRSRGAKVIYKAGGRPAEVKQELWAVVVGTSDYIGDAIDLRFAAHDAEAFSGALSIAASRFLGDDRVHVRTLSTARTGAADRPTRANIEAAFGEVARRARPADVLVVYLSGHGVAPAGTDEYYYLTADARSLELSDPEVRRRDALSASDLAELIRVVPATGRQVLVLDTCAAGRALDVLGQRRAVSGEQARALEQIKDRTGLHLLAGAAADAASYEASRYGQGLLTYSLLLGMTGPGLKDTELDALTWFGYAVDEVPLLARGIGGVQRPLLSSPRGGSSFPIGRLEAADRGKIPLPRERPLVVRSTLVEEDADEDVLDLGGRVDEALSDASEAGDGMGPVFVNAREGEGAYRLAGRYRLEGDALSVQVQVRRGGERVGRFEAKGSRSDLDKLAREIVTRASAYFKP